MLHVTIANIDRSYHGVYETRKPGCDRNLHEIANMAVADLVANHDFFDDNFAFPHVDPEDKHVYGMMMLPGEEEDLEYKADAEDTYWITIRPFEPNKMMAD